MMSESRLKNTPQWLTNPSKIDYISGYEKALRAATAGGALSACDL
jgi:hypothetical protein